MLMTVSHDNVCDEFNTVLLFVLFNDHHAFIQHAEGDLITIIDSSDLNLAKQLSRLLKITIFGEFTSINLYHPFASLARQTTPPPSHRVY